MRNDNIANHANRSTAMSAARACWGVAIPWKESEG
jgi:hypothetical protein